MEGRDDRGVVLGFSSDLGICAGRVGQQEIMFPGRIFGLVFGWSNSLITSGRGECSRLRLHFMWICGCLCAEVSTIECLCPYPGGFR